LERSHSASSALTGCPGVSSGPEAVEPVVEVMSGGGAGDRASGRCR
jgi:hypothetical protein